MIWRRLGLGGLVFLVFVLPYAQTPWWQFFHSTIVLLALWGLRWGKEGLPRLGLGLPRRDIAIVVVAFPAIWLLASLLQGAVARGEGLVRLSLPFPESVDPLYQALNEELLLGFLLLMTLRRVVGHPHWLAASVALAFALAHVAFYRWLSVHQTWLSPGAVAAVLLVGLARNYLILVAGHVGFAWTLHAAWNLAFLGGAWFRAGVRVEEPDLFGIFLGHASVIGAVAGVALFAGILVARGGVHERFRPQ